MATKDHFAQDAFGQFDSAVPECRLTLSELAFLSGTTPDVIGELVAADLIGPCATSPELHFKVGVIATVRRILRLHRHLQIDFDSMVVIFDLLERIEDLERRIKDLEKE